MSVDLNVDTVDEAIAAAVLKLRSVREVLQTLSLLLAMSHQEKKGPD